MDKVFTLKELADLSGGEVIGDGGFEITGVAPLESAGEKDICMARSPQYLKMIPQSRAKAFIVGMDPGIKNYNFIIHQNPYACFAKILSFICPLEKKKEGIHPSAVTGGNLKCGKGVHIGANSVIGDNVVIKDNTFIYPGTVIGDDVEIGEDSRIHPNVTIYSGCVIGDRTTIHSSSVIGSDGFGFAPDIEGWVKVNHLGRAVIGNDVEIGAGNTIDRGTFDDTKIGNGVKTDNQVHIAHNVIIEDGTILVGQSGIAGSTKIGKNCIIAGKAGISGHLEIGNNVIIGPMAGITGNIKDGSVVSGVPEMPHKLWLKVQRIMPRLPDMRRKISFLEKKIKDLEEKNG